MAALFALCAALASAIGAVIRLRSAHEVTDEPVGHWELFRLLLRDSKWWLGGGAAVANYALLAVALDLGSVILVTSLQVTVLLFALPINARITHHRVTRREWMWAALLAAAIAVIFATADRAQGQQRASLETWGVVAIVMVPALVACVAAARIWSGTVAAVLLAVVAGSCAALLAVLIKGLDEAVEDGFVRCCAPPNCMP